MKQYTLRYFALVLAIVTMAGCENTASDLLLSPNASVSSGPRVANTKAVAVANRAAAVIGAVGGTIAVGGHRLIVPANAVASPTNFSVQVVEAQAVHVKLRATRSSDGAAVTQFPVVPVRLVLDVANVDAVDMSRVKIVYLRDGTYAGSKEVLQSTADAGTRTVQALLSHFSDYAAALD